MLTLGSVTCARSQQIPYCRRLGYYNTVLLYTVQEETNKVVTAEGWYSLQETNKVVTAEYWYSVQETYKVVTAECWYSVQETNKVVTPKCWYSVH